MIRPARLLVLLMLGAGPAWADARLGHDVVPLSEAVRLDLDPARKDYSGSVRIALEVRAAIDSFTLHAQEMTLTRVALEGGAASTPLSAREGKAGAVTLRAVRPVAPGRYTLAIDFSNDFNTRATSLYRLETGGNAYVFTQFEAVDARGAFPCWDEPSFKIPWRLTLEVPAHDLAISNTPIETQSTRGARKTVVFRTTSPLPSYLLAIAVGPLELVPIPGMSVPGNVVTVRGASRLAADAARVVPPILAALERWFGRPYPYEKLDLIAVPEFWPGAMENAGAITFADRVLLVDPATATPRQRLILVTYIAHEVSHQWFGDLVTMDWWDDLWLNESFASWMGDKISEEVLPGFDIGVSELDSRRKAMTLDARVSTRAMRQPVADDVNLDQLADELAYDKGQAMLLMFERWLGPEAMQRGVRDYLEAHAWKNAVAADLWTALSNAAGRDVNGPMASFLEQPGVPLVSAEALGGGRVRLRQRRFLTAGTRAPAGRGWGIPVVLRYSDGRREWTQGLLLTEAERVITLEHTRAPAWIHPNADEAGYYRWWMPADSRRRLEAAAGALSVRERVGLLSNTSALLDADLVDGGDYLGTLEAFAGDSAAAVFEQLVNGIHKIDETFITPELAEPFSGYVSRVLGPAIRRIGTTKRAGEADPITIVRSSLLETLGNLGRAGSVVDEARAWTRDYLRDPARVDPTVSEAMLTLAAMRGDANLFESYRTRFERAEVPSERRTLLNGLGGFRDPLLVERALDYSLDGPLRPQEVLSIPSNISRTPALRERVWRWTIAHYDAITKRIPPTYASMLARYAGGCSEQRLEAAEAFFAAPGHSPAGIREQLLKVSDAVHDCARLRARESPVVARALGASPSPGEPSREAGAPRATPVRP